MRPVGIIVNYLWDEKEVAVEMEEELERVRNDPKCQVPARLRDGFSTDCTINF